MHRSSMFSGDGGRALRRVGSSPRAPPPPRHCTLSRSESIKKKSGPAKRSKRARMRAGLTAALQELRLAARKHGARGSGAGSASAAVVASVAGVQGGGGCCGAGAAAPLHHVSEGAEAQAGRGVVVVAGGRRVNAAGGGWSLLLVVAVLALACVVALGRAPAVCCCTCAAWLCRGPFCGSASTGGRHRSSEPSAAAAQCRAVRCLRA